MELACSQFEIRVEFRAFGKRLRSLHETTSGPRVRDSPYCFRVHEGICSFAIDPEEKTRAVQWLDVIELYRERLFRNELLAATTVLLHERTPERESVPVVTDHHAES